MTGYKDFLGRELQVGDDIVYPIRASSSMWMERATVVERTTVEGPWFDRSRIPALKAKKASTGRVVTLTVLKNVVQI